MTDSLKLEVNLNRGIGKAILTGAEPGFSAT